MHSFSIALGLAGLIAAARGADEDPFTYPLPSDYPASDFCVDFVGYCKYYYFDTENDRISCTLSGDQVEVTCFNSYNTDGNPASYQTKQFYNEVVKYRTSPEYHETTDPITIDRPSNYNSTATYCEDYLTNCTAKTEQCTDADAGKVTIRCVYDGKDDNPFKVGTLGVAACLAEPGSCDDDY